MSQPRRVLPSVVRSQWDGTSNTTVKVFAAWIEVIAAEKAQPAKSIKERYILYLMKGEDIPLKPLSRSEVPMFNLLKFALNIITEELHDPLIVSERPNGGFWIIDGERRWWALRLIHYLLGDEKWLSVPIVVEEVFSRFRQAATGNRDEWNMIARTRLFALLMMEVLASEYAFVAYHDAESDREFYAQVADLEVPSLSMQKILAGCGVTSKSSFVPYRMALRLPDEDWTKADEGNWSSRQVEARFSALNSKKTQRKSSEKTPVKVQLVIEKKSDFKKQFDRDWKRPEKREALAQELDDLEAWIKTKRSELGR